MRELRNAVLAAMIFMSLMILQYPLNYTVASDNEDNAYLHLNEVMDKYHQTFDVYTDRDAGGNHFFPSGWMGDTGDITFDSAWTENPYSGTSCIKITYSATVVLGWAGIYWQHPENNWGTVENAGYDLTGATAINFYARGPQGGEKIEFFAGGIDGEFGDSMPKVSLGYVTLSADWQQYTIDISGQDLSYIIGGFGWVTNQPLNPDGATFYLDNIQYNLPRLDEKRFLRSYETIQLEDPDFVLTNAAYTYDEALAALAYIARGTDDDLRRAELILDAFVHAQEHDRYYTDGRLRNAYMAGDLFDQTDETETVRLPGWWDDESEEWYEDLVQVSTYTGNLAWVMLALLTHYEAKGGAEYRDAALSIGEWIVRETKDDESPFGYTAGYEGWEPNPTKLTYKSTEHNIDVYSAFIKAWNITGDNDWKERAIHALLFLHTMWDASEGHFWIGTEEDGKTPWTHLDAQPMDVNTWGLMALNNDQKYREGINWVENNCSVTIDGFSGFDFNPDKDGIWWEGTAQMVIAYQILEDETKAEYYLNQLRDVQMNGENSNGKGIIAATPDGITTGLYIGDNPWLYYSRLHVGATSWYLFAERRFNPLETSCPVCFSGDVSGDGQITAYDASLILQHVVGLRELSAIEQEVADVTGDDTISALDAALILQYTVGLITIFPVDRPPPPIAPALNPKTETKLLAETIKQLEGIFLTKEQKQVLEQLKSLILNQLLPKHTTLLQNYPNPFNPETWIPFQLAQDASVTISIYNTKGQHIRTISLGNKNAGTYVKKDKAAHWDGRDRLGEKVASGMYYYMLQAGEFKATRKMAIVK